MTAAMLLLLAQASGASAGATGSPLIIDRDRIDRAVRTETKAMPEPTRTATSIVAERPDVIIRGITFRGEKALPRLAKAARPYIGKHADRATLKALADALALAYAQSDIAFYTVAIGAQDFADGQVRIDIVEGYVAATAFDTVKGPQPKRARRIVEQLIGVRPLSRTRFERQLLLMRDTPGLDAEVAATGAGDDGALSLAVKASQKRSEFKGGYSSRTTALVGDGQFDASLKLFGLGTQGDQLTLTAAAAANFKDFRYLSAGYQVPLADNGLTLSASGAYLETRTAALASQGTARTAGVTLSYPLLRSYKRDVALAVGVDGVDSDNAALGSVIASEHSRALRASGTLVLRGTKRSVEVAVSASQGLNALSARLDPGLAKAGFRKVNLSAAVGQRIGKKVNARLRTSGQFTGNRLPAAERFAVGGPDFGRAFDVGLLSADRGIAGSAELGVTPFKGKTFAATELYAFVDGAKVRLIDRTGFAGADFDLASAGGGVRFRFRDKVQLDLEAAKALSRPYAGITDDVRLSVGWRVSI